MHHGRGTQPDRELLDEQEEPADTREVEDHGEAHVQVGDAVLDPGEGRECVHVGEREHRQDRLDSGPREHDRDDPRRELPDGELDHDEQRREDEDDERQHRPRERLKHGTGTVRAEVEQPPAGRPVEPADGGSTDDRGDEGSGGPRHEGGAGRVTQPIPLLPVHSFAPTRFAWRRHAGSRAIRRSPMTT